MGLNAGVVLERLVNDAAVEGAQGLQFHHVTPAADLLGGFLGLLDERFASLRAVAAHVHKDFGHRRVLLEENPVGDVLEVGQGLALAPDEAARVVGLHIEQDAFFHAMLFDRGGEAEEFQNLVQRGLRFSRHTRVDS